MLVVKKTLVENEHISAFNGWIGRLVGSGTLTTDSMAKLCADTTHVTKADALSVLEELRWLVLHYLGEGFTVDLGELGGLHLTLKNKMVDDIDDWTVDGNIRKVMVRYTPTPELRKYLDKGNSWIKIKVIG